MLGVRSQNVAVLDRVRNLYIVNQQSDTVASQEARDVVFLVVTTQLTSKQRQNHAVCLLGFIGMG